MTLRRWLQRRKLPSRDALSLRTVFRAGATLAFFGLLAVLIAISVSADIVLLAILASLFVSKMLYLVLPMEPVLNRLEWLESGDAGDDIYDDAATRAPDTGEWWEFWR